MFLFKIVGQVYVFQKNASPQIYEYEMPILSYDYFNCL
jgi:hypothetical protein